MLVEGSGESRMVVMASLPMTKTFLCVPAPTNCAPTVSAYAKPEHAADRSKPHAFLAAMHFCTRQAVAGENMFGVTVASTIKSISAGVGFCFATQTLGGFLALLRVGVGLVVPGGFSVSAGAVAATFSCGY